MTLSNFICSEIVRIRSNLHNFRIADFLPFSNVTKSNNQIWWHSYPVTPDDRKRFVPDWKMRKTEKKTLKHNYDSIV